MIVTYSWLKDFVHTDLDAEELAHRLTMAGLEVEAMERIGEGLDSVVVARLEAVDPHPNADRLTLCRVNNGSETLPVVCGATNHKAGDLVAFAQVGTVLPGDFKIKKSKIRGEVSMGMLCSESELGLAEESEGIMILPEGLELGEPALEALGLKDVRYEIGLTPNRPDCLSVVGVAREVAAMTGKPVNLPEAPLAEAGEPIDAQTSITVEEPGLCPRYAARLIRGVKIGPSPDWMVRRLESVGQRSINNVVDVTNFVLMELGHPLHAFDFNLLRERRIVVRKAAEGERFTTLDDQERTLSANELMICDGEGPVALAGIMGGQNSEVGEQTVDILLESAYFNPTTIRRSGKRLGMHTESSHRFERGADVNMVPVALDRAAALIAEVAGGQVAPGVIDAYPEPIGDRHLSISVQRTNELLGLQLELTDIIGYLRSIGLGAEPVQDRQEQKAHVVVPPFRPDLTREVDLIEEVARLHGYDDIPTTMPQGRMLSHRPDPRQALVREVRDALVAEGFSEAINYSFNAPSALDKVLLPGDDPRRKQVKLLNPLTEEQSVMRTTLVPSLLETVTRNLAYRTVDLQLFELRPVFIPRQGEELPAEGMRATVLACGSREPLGWAQQGGHVDFYDLKGVVERLLERLGVEGVSWAAGNSEPFLHPGKSCQILCGERVLGAIGELHPRVAENFEIDQPLYLFDLDLEVVMKVGGSRAGFQGLSRFPDVTRDSAFLIDEEVSAQQVLDCLERVRAKHLEKITLFDLYRGKGVPEGKKSLAIRASYRSGEKTLTDEEINASHEKLVKALGKEFGAEIR